MDTQVKTIELKVRPRRIAFLINPDDDFQICKKIIESCCTVWGGIYNIFIPTDGSQIDKMWWDFIECIDPDFFLSYTEIQPELRRDILEKTTPFNLSQAPHFWGGRVIPDDPSSISSSYNLSMIEVHSELEDEVFSKRTDSLSLIEPLDLEDYQFAAVGVYPTEIWRKGLEKHFKGSLSKNTDFALNLEYCSVQGGMLSPLSLTSLYLSLRSEGRMNFIFIVGKTTDIQDFSLYWNLRSLSLYNEIFWIPLEILERNSNFEQFIDWVNSIYPKAAKIGLNFTTVIDVLSLSLPKSRLDQIANFMNKKLVGPLQAQAVKKQNISRLLPKKLEICNRQSYVLDERVFHQGKVKVKCPRPHFLKSENKMYGTWVVDINFISSDESPQGLIVNKCVAVPELFVPLTDDKGKPRKRQVRISRYGFSCAVTTEDRLIPLRIPPTMELFGRILKAYRFDAHVNNIFAEKDEKGFRGFAIELSDKGIYADGAIRLFGGLSKFAEYLRKNEIRSVFDEFVCEPEKEKKKKREIGNEKVKFGRRRELSKREIVEIVERCIDSGSSQVSGRMQFEMKQLRENRAEWLIQQLIQHGVFLQGCNIKCPKCRNEDWYPIDEIGRTYVCHRCYDQNTTPAELEWKYRLAEIIFQAYYNDAIVPILTLDLLKNESKDSFLFIPEVILYKDSKRYEDNKKYTEIDICCLSDGELIIGECKRPDKIEKNTIKTYRYLAKRLRVNQLIFSNFTDEKCKKQFENCVDCRRTDNGGQNWCYADNAFSFSSSETEPSTKEMIQELREDLSIEGILVRTFCKSDLLRGKPALSYRSPIGSRL